MSGPFATATEFCEWTGMAVPSDLSRLQSLLDASSALIRGYCGQTISQVTGDVITVPPQVSQSSGFYYPFPTAYGHEILLPERPVTAITALTTNSVAFTAYSFTPEGVVYRTDGQPWIYTTVITYTHGYTETSDTFKQVKTICMQMTKRAFTGDESGQAISLGGIPVETAGFPMALFLTQDEKNNLPTKLAVFG